jgi:NDP-sugar pyrophosphorylase family protein
VAEHGTVIDAAILAGGLGTRLRQTIGDRPKVLAPVAGRPFLSHLLDHVAAAGMRRAVLCTGYLADQVQATFGDRYGALALSYSRELSPQGTAIPCWC